uniref:ubiquitinyl hydrolase 1 n=1 Tax=Pithovirus LCPAC403 TaxID=2506596 RepID=A0A481ZBU1_9VIRU|nr:MAG: ubiquitin carboxyl-terminal hydrolase [Pithovirus LCPAC403]
MNAVLQCINGTRKIGHCSHPTSVVNEWCKLRKNLKTSKEPVDPTDFKKALDETKKFEKDKGSQDSVGFLVVLLDMLPCEYTMFKGRFKSRLRCSRCTHTNNTYNDFTVMNLSITGDSLDTIYKNFTKTDNDVDYSCERCKKNTKHSKKITVNKFPQRLIISFKRFTSSLKVRRDHIEFSEEMMLEGNSYKLYAIVEFQGSYSNGHYIASVYDFDQNLWKVYNDSLDSDRIFCIEEFISSAYILMYEMF